MWGTNPRKGEKSPTIYVVLNLKSAQRNQFMIHNIKASKSAQPALSRYWAHV